MRPIVNAAPRTAPSLNLNTACRVPSIVSSSPIGNWSARYRSAPQLLSAQSRNAARPKPCETPSNAQRANRNNHFYNLNLESTFFFPCPDATTCSVETPSMTLNVPHWRLVVKRLRKIVTVVSIAMVEWLSKESETKSGWARGPPPRARLNRVSALLELSHDPCFQDPSGR